MKQAFAVLALVLALAGRLHAQARPDFQVTRAAQPPVIDGVLEDEVWKRAALPLGEWLSYQPNRGDKMPAGLRTEVKRQRLQRRLDRAQPAPQSGNQG